MVILEKLPKLRTLKLREDSYLGKKMQVSTSGFPQLEVLQLSSLGNWKRLIIGKGGMSKLTHLQIFESVLDIEGLVELFHLQKVDFIDSHLYHPSWISSLPWCTQLALCRKVPNSFMLNFIFPRSYCHTSTTKNGS